MKKTETTQKTQMLNNTKRNMKKIITVVSTAAVLTVSALALEGCSAANSSNANNTNNGKGGAKMEQGKHGGGGKGAMGGQRGKHRGSLHAAERPELTEAQKSELKVINDKYEAQMLELSAKLKEQGDIIKAELSKDSPNKATIDAAVEAGSKLEASRKKLMIERSIEKKELLGNK